MADLGNLKILLDMATTGNLKSTLIETDKRLDKMREKASSLHLGFDDKSVSALSTKMRDIAASMQEVSHNAGTSFVQGMQKSAEATKATTTQMQQQVTLSADLEAILKEMSGILRTIAEAEGKVTASKKASAAAVKEEEAEEKKLYDITRLRQIAEEKNGQLTKDQVSVLKQMEAIEKALVAIDEKHSTHLADQLKKWMHYDGVTKEQLGTYQALITRMQAAMKLEEKTAREAEKAARSRKQAAREREAATKRQAQLETSIVRVETPLLGINEARLTKETQLLITKMRSGQITQEEVNRLSAVLAKEQAIISAEHKKGEAAAKTNAHFGRQSGLLQQTNSYLATYFSVIGAVNLIRNLVRITGEFEAQHVALRAILQDVAGADRIFYQLQELAEKSPFTFRNLTDYAKQLSAFSVPMNEIYDTTKRLADVSAGLGVDMSRIILAYGQIRSASFLRGQEVRQLTEAGIPVLQELAKQFSEIEGRMISAGEVFDRISARQVPFEMIEKMFKDLTSAGGKFYQMQEVLAETVKGKVSNLQDAWEIMLSKVGDANSGAIKDAISTITEMLQNYETMIPAIKAVALSLVILSTSMSALNVITKVRILLMKEETRAMMKLKLAYGAGFAALAAGIGIITYFVQKSKQAKAEAEELSRSMDAMGEDFRKTFSMFAVAWQDVEKAYDRITKERHNAFKRALNESSGLLQNISKGTQDIIEDTNKVIGPVETINRELKDMSGVSLSGLSRDAEKLLAYTNKVVGPIETIQRKVKEIATDDNLLSGVDEKTRELIESMNKAVGPIETLKNEIKEISSESVVFSNVSEETQRIANEMNKVVGPAEKIRRKLDEITFSGGTLEASMISSRRIIKQIVSDGGELEAAIALVVDETKQLTSDGGELNAAMVSVDRNVKQLVSDGGELEASVVTATGKTIPKLNDALLNVVQSTKELGLVGEPVRKSQEEIEKQFNASKKSTEEYEKALNDLYEKYPNFIDENVRQRIAVEDLAGAWDLATMNMRQYYADQATKQAHSILQKGYDKQTSDIIENLNKELRIGKDYQSFRDQGLINEGAIQLIDAYVMGIKSEEELSEDLAELIKKINNVGAGLSVGIVTGTEKVIYSEVSGHSLIDKARNDYADATNSYIKAIKSSDKVIEEDFTSSRHKKVAEYLLNAGLSADSVLAMKNDETGFETWEQWQERLRGEYKKTGEENQKVIETMFSHFGLVVNPDELTSVQHKVSDWMKANPANGVSLPGLDIKPETNISEFAENALKMMQDDAKDLGRLPKEFQKTEEQSWEEYANMLEEMGDEAHAMVARRIKYLGEMSQALWGDDVFGSQKELLKQQKQKDKENRQYIQDQLANLRQQFQDLKEIKGWYDKLRKIGMSDTDTRRFLASFNMGVPEKGFNTAFDNLSEQFIKFGDKNSAQDVQNFKNGRDLKSDIDSMISSAKAVEKYTEALRDLEAQTKRLNLSGFAQELDKIIVDADSKNRQLETNWAQKAEELEKAKGGWIQRYRVENEKASAEEAEKAWEKFYAEQTAIAKRAMDTQREYNRKVAQEQINDKASKWLEEMMKENNINLNDMGDKSLEQVNTLISRMEALVSDRSLANLIPPELKKDAALINVEFSQLLSTIRKTANTKLGDLSVEKMKKTLTGVKAITSLLGISSDTSAVESSYSTLAQALSEVANAQEDVNTAQKEFDDAKLAGDLDAKAKAFTNLAVAQGVLAQKTDEAADAQARYNAALAMAGVGAFAQVLGKVASKMKELADAAGNKALSEFSDVVGGIMQNLNAAASGYAAAASAGAGAYAWIGAVIGGVSDLIIQLANVQVEIEKYNYKMGRANSAWALSVAQVRNEYALLQEQFDTMFGSANMSKMAGWADIIRQQGEALRKFNSGEDWINFLYGVVNGENTVRDLFNALKFETSKTAQTLGDYQIKTHEYNWFEEIFGNKDEYKSLRELAPELFNEDGSLNFGYLDEFKKTEWYNELSDGWKQTLDEMAEANKSFEDACKQMTDYLSSIFGEVGASISDQLISAFEKTGEVAFDTGDILSGVAKKFVSDWTQSFLTTKYLKGLGDSINDIWMDSSISMEEQVSQSLGLLRDSLTSMSDSLPYIQQFYEGLEDQFHWADGAGEELGDAIKTAMVEQNSSLIAGYINSMRADLTMQRNEIMRNISPAVTSISSGFDTHLMYMESVAGNVQNIWERLNLLTTPGNGVKIDARI